ncbi:hypothetical protein BHE74_00029845 [Ensete ventricosum]|nr:hypothetical protein BHE74_00029845 [Ensete ventricosum]
MLEAYDSGSDPMEHVATFWVQMAFPTTLRGIARGAVEALVAEKREDQKCPWAEPSRGPPPGLPRKRTERVK